jgi:hypothetical protein
MKYTHFISMTVFFFLQVAPAQDTISSSPVWIPLNSTPRDTGLFVVTQTVNALACRNGKLFAGGNFKKIGSLATGGVVQFENGAWKQIVDVGKYGVVNALVFDTSNNLLIGGDFDSSGVNISFNIRSWNGTKATDLDKGVRDPIRAIAVDEKNNYYVGGDVFKTGGIVNSYIDLVLQKWDGTAWSSYYQFPEMHCVNGSPCSMSGQGINSIVSDYSKGIFYTGYGCNQPYSTRYRCPDAYVVDFEGNLYFAGGTLITISQHYYPGLCKQTWTPSGSTITDTALAYEGYPGEINALAVDKKGNLFFGGNFNVKPQASSIAVWDGKTIKPLGKGITGTVKSLAIDENAGMLYVGGDFDYAGGKYSPMIAAVDLYHSEAAKNKNGAGQSINRLELKLVNQTLTVSNATAHDRVFLYSLSGRMLLESLNIPAVSLQKLQPQPILVVVKRNGKILVAQKILVLNKLF